MGSMTLRGPPVLFGTPESYLRDLTQRADFDVLAPNDLQSSVFHSSVIIHKFSHKTKDCRRRTSHTK